MQIENKSTVIDSKSNHLDKKEIASLEGIDKVRDILFGHELRSLQEKIYILEKLLSSHGLNLNEIDNKISELYVSWRETSV